MSLVRLILCLRCLRVSFLIRKMKKIFSIWMLVVRKVSPNKKSRRLGVIIARRNFRVDWWKWRRNLKSGMWKKRKEFSVKLRICMKLMRMYSKTKCRKCLRSWNMLAISRKSFEFMRNWSAFSLILLKNWRKKKEKSKKIK